MAEKIWIGQVRVTVLGTRPRVWRRLAAPATIQLRELARSDSIRDGVDRQVSASFFCGGPRASSRARRFVGGGVFGSDSFVAVYCAQDDGERQADGAGRGRMRTRCGWGRCAGRTRAGFIMHMRSGRDGGSRWRCSSISRRSFGWSIRGA